MKLELTLDDKTYWVEVKDKWTRRDIRKWYELGKAEAGDFDTDESSEAYAYRVAEGKLAQLREWSPTRACFCEDVDGKTFNSLDEITPEDLDAFDAPVYDLLMNAALLARSQRSRLGEMSGRRL